jgi:hypothetical protein
MSEPISFKNTRPVMNVRKRSESRSLTRRQRFSEPSETPPKSGLKISLNPAAWAKGFIDRAVITLLFNAAMSFGMIKAVAALVMAAILSIVFGYHVAPPSAVKDDITAKVELAGEKIGIKPQMAGVMGGGLIPPVVPSIHKTPEQIAAGEERDAAERQRKEDSRRNELMARADLIKFSYESSWTTEKLDVEVRNAEREAASQKERGPLLERAEKVGFAVDPTSDNATLRKGVEAAEKHAAAMDRYKAEHEKWEKRMEVYAESLKHGPTASCLGCHYAMRISPARTGKGVCPRCHGHFTISQARAAYRPPAPPREPLPPSDKPGLLERIRNKF